MGTVTVGFTKTRCWTSPRSFVCTSSFTFIEVPCLSLYTINYLPLGGSLSKDRISYLYCVDQVYDQLLEGHTKSWRDSETKEQTFPTTTTIRMGSHHTEKTVKSFVITYTVWVVCLTENRPRVIYHRIMLTKRRRVFLHSFWFTSLLLNNRCLYFRCR